MPNTVNQNVGTNSTGGLSELSELLARVSLDSETQNRLLSQFATLQRRLHQVQAREAADEQMLITTINALSDPEVRAKLPADVVNWYADHQRRAKGKAVAKAEARYLNAQNALTEFRRAMLVAGVPTSVVRQTRPLKLLAELRDAREQLAKVQASDPLSTEY